MEYLVKLERVVECDDEANAIEQAIEEIQGAGGLEALDFEVERLNDPACEEGFPLPTGATEGFELPKPVGRTVSFYLGGHLTFVVDEDGTVIRLEIMPYQETPACEDLPEGFEDNEDSWEQIDAICEKADEKGWEVRGLRSLPDDITWEV